MTPVAPVADPERKAAIVRRILEALPDWFGIPEAIDRYVGEARGLPLWATADETGFITLRRHSPATVELHCLGVLAEHHHRGIGRALLQAAEASLRDGHTRLLTVKTLAPSAESQPYEATRRFYTASGFLPLEVFPELWSPENPCLMMAKIVSHPRRFTEKTLVLASHNPGKAKEIAELLQPFAIEVISAGALGLPEPEETEDSFIGNAKLKALAAAKAANLPALADDSGLCVDALDGAPGIFSARWAGPSKDFGHAMERVLKGIDGKPRGAHFIAALALAWPDGHCEAFEGRVDGVLADRPTGGRGFGYDPIFRPHGHDITFGEMDPGLKHKISHRADAFRQLVAGCFG